MESIAQNTRLPCQFYFEINFALNLSISKLQLSSFGLKLLVDENDICCHSLVRTSIVFE